MPTANNYPPFAKKLEQGHKAITKKLDSLHTKLDRHCKKEDENGKAIKKLSTKVDGMVTKKEFGKVAEDIRAIKTTLSRLGRR